MPELTNSAHYPVCLLLGMIWTGVGAKGSVSLPQTSGRGSGEDPTNSAPPGKARQEQPAHVTVTKRHELCRGVFAGTEMAGPSGGLRRGSSLAWNGVRKEWGWAVCL